MVAGSWAVFARHLRSHKLSLFRVMDGDYTCTNTMEHRTKTALTIIIQSRSTHHNQPMHFCGAASPRMQLQLCMGFQFKPTRIRTLSSVYFIFIFASLGIFFHNFLRFFLY